MTSLSVRRFIMNKQEIFALLQANPACSLATIEDDQPRVRGVAVYRSNEDGIIFHTGQMKDLYKQLVANPKIEMCFNDWQNMIQVRVTGVASALEDQSLKEEIVTKRDFLKPLVEQTGSYDFLKVFKVNNLKAVVWTMQTNLEPKEIIDLD